MKNGRLIFLVSFVTMLMTHFGFTEVSAQDSNEEFLKVEEGGEPRVELIDPVYEFGKVYRGEIIEHTFTVRNAGDASLVIKGIHRDCGCTGAQLTKQGLAPGEEMDIDVSLNTAGLAEGELMKSIRLETDDPGEPETVMTMTGELLVTARMDPPSVEIKGVMPREMIPEQIVRIVPVEGFDLEIKKVEIEHDLITAKLMGKDDSGIYRVAVNIATETTKNVISGSIKAFTNLDEEPVLIIPVRAVLDQPFVIVPNEIRFTGIKPEYEGKLTYNAVIKNNLEKPLKILDIKSENEFIEYSLETIEDGQKYRLKIMLVPGFPEKGFEAKVRIFTDNEMYPEREIVVQVNMSPDKAESPEDL